MKYLVINLRQLRKKEPIMLVLILMCSFTAAVILYFSLGMIMHYQENRRRGDINSYEMSVLYNELEQAQRSQNTDFQQKAENYLSTEKNLEYMTVGGLRSFLKNVPKALFMNCNQMIVNSYYDADDVSVEFYDNSGAMGTNNIYLVRFSFHYDEASGIISPSSKSKDKLIYGDYLNVEDQAYGNHNAVIGIGIYNDLFVKNRKKDKDMGYNVTYDNSYDFSKHTEFTMFGETYHIVGITDGVEIDIPFNSLPDEVPLATFWSTCMIFLYDVPVTSQQEELLQQYLETNYPGTLSVKEMKHTYINASFYTMLIVVLVLVILIAVTNIAVIFRYILMKRKKQIAIFKLCGCRSCTAMFVGEGLLLTVPAFVVGALFYHLLLRPLLREMFVFMGAAYTPFNLVSVFVLFAMLSLLALYISIRPIVKQTPAAIWKEEALC